MPTKADKPQHCGPRHASPSGIERPRGCGSAGGKRSAADVHHGPLCRGLGEVAREPRTPCPVTRWRGRGAGRCDSRLRGPQPKTFASRKSAEPGVRTMSTRHRRSCSTAVIGSTHPLTSSDTIATMKPPGSPHTRARRACRGNLARRGRTGLRSPRKPWLKTRPRPTSSCTSTCRAAPSPAPAIADTRARCDTWQSTKEASNE
jgi:hypothetical protein